jgi:hypothetical protein
MSTCDTGQCEHPAPVVPDIPYKGYSTVCPENEGTCAALVLDGPTYESGDTSI